MAPITIPLHTIIGATVRAIKAAAEDRYRG